MTLATYLQDVNPGIPIGFTGTREGMTQRQTKLCAEILEYTKPIRADHGGCRGADEEFHSFLRQLPIEEVHVWPSSMPKWWARCCHPSETHIERGHIKHLVVEEVMHPLARNHEIVRNKQLIIACPKIATHTLRSGTWATIRAADKLGIKTLVIAPHDPLTELEERQRLGR